MQKRTFRHAMIITVLVMLTGCASLQVQARVSSCQQMITDTFSANNRIPRQERQVVLALDKMAQGTFTPAAIGTFPCKYVPPPCRWYGVICTSGHIVEIDFSNNPYFTGQIPAELGDLSQLHTLYLHGNQLTGEIPPELGNLSQLRRLSVATNQLTGKIPPELGNLTQLQELYLSSNQLDGEIPPELGNLSQLQALGLDRNQLSGEIPSELGNLSQLQILVLYGNQLSGPLPDALTGFSLEKLYLADTELCVPRTAEFESWVMGILLRDFEDVPYCE